VALAELPAADGIGDLWKDLIEKLQKKKDVRNKVAHGTVTTCQGPSGKSTIRLTPPIYDLRRINPPRRKPAVTRARSCWSIQGFVKI
jgi:hypothetical protein